MAIAPEECLNVFCTAPDEVYRIKGVRSHERLIGPSTGCMSQVIRLQDYTVRTVTMVTRLHGH